AVVHGGAHQVPVLAVVRQGDADLALTGDDVDDRAAQHLAELVGGGGSQTVLADRAGGVGGDQLGGAREGAGVGGEDLCHAPRLRAVAPRSETGASRPFTGSSRQSRGQVGTRLRSPKACSTRRTGGQYFD